MFYNFRKSKKAFTLVELIVVIAIIGILGAVVGISVSAFVSNAKKRSCKSTAESIAEAWEMFIVLEDGTKWVDYFKEQFPTISIAKVSMTSITKETTSKQGKALASGKIRFVSNDGYYCDVTVTKDKTPTVGDAIKGTAALANLLSAT